MTDRLGSIDSQYFDGAGDPLVAGKLYFYESGTTTPKNTFADINETIANTNPVVLSGAGVPPNIFYSGAAKVILTDSDSVQFRVMDPIGGSAGEAFSDWDSASIYAINDLVLGSDGNYYKGLSTANIGNDPTSDTVNWTRVQFIGLWTTGSSYSIDDVVQGSDGLLYVSLTNTNQGNDPISDIVNWLDTGGVAVYEEFLVSGTFTKDVNAKFVYVEVISGGGSGATLTLANVSGGSGGGFANGTFLASAVGTTETVTIGAGGVHAGTGSGVSGGDSSFGSLVSSFGGSRGSSYSAVHITKRGTGNDTSTIIFGAVQYLRDFTRFDPNSGAGTDDSDSVTINGANTTYGGAGGGAGGLAGGVSVLGGDGGAGTASGVASDGSVPGGGGGSTRTNIAGEAGSGGDGRVRVWQW